MFALALLAAAVAPEPVAPPGFVRVDVETSRSVDDAPDGLTTESLETRVASDGSFYASVTDGDRRRTISGTVQVVRSPDDPPHFVVRVEYADQAFDGAVPIGGGRWEPVVSEFSTRSSATLRETGVPVVVGGSEITSEEEDHTVVENKLVRLSLLDRRTPPIQSGLADGVPTTVLPPKP